MEHSAFHKAQAMWWFITYNSLHHCLTENKEEMICFLFSPVVFTFIVKQRFKVLTMKTNAHKERSSITHLLPEKMIQTRATSD